MTSALAAKKAKQRGPRCGLGVLLQNLDDIDRQALLNALESDMFSTDIAEALRDEGHLIRHDAVQRHRRRSCACGDAE